ncbi:MAG: M23 family metallopeptidase, partial [Bacteroidota bacterium]
VKACLPGVVFQSEYTSAYGFVIGIQHANNVISFYKHNSTLLKDVGSQVTAGEAIAIIGNTGTQSTGPHLHFELWRNGQVLDPTDYLAF